MRDRADLGQCECDTLTSRKRTSLNASGALQLAPPLQIRRSAGCGFAAHPLSLLTT